MRSPSESGRSLALHALAGGVGPALPAARIAQPKSNPVGPAEIDSETQP